MEGNIIKSVQIKYTLAFDQKFQFYEFIIQKHAHGYVAKTQPSIERWLNQ